MTSRLRSVAIWAAVALATMWSSGCGYSLAGRGTFLPAYIKTIGVPLFQNDTSVYDVDRKVTERVISELIGRGRYTVLPQSTGVDAVLAGEITGVTFVPSGFNQQQQATRYVLTLVAKVELRDVKANKVIWANPALQFSEQYDASSTTSSNDASAFLRQDANALDRLASEFARAIVSAMLEAF
jgi:lipopolysaccharide assembly LptE-like protein